MRIANGVLAALLLLFAVVQWNDPDGLFWIFVYGIGAIWCGIAALRPALYASPFVFGLYALTCIAALAGLFYFWPTTPEWWMQDVWWETETAREGMGMMILVIALIVAGFIVRRARRLPA
ncbi:MAG: transmembrane 220 family protein [Pseudomonadota bacterium]